MKGELDDLRSSVDHLNKEKVSCANSWFNIFIKLFRKEMKLVCEITSNLFNRVASYARIFITLNIIIFFCIAIRFSLLFIFTNFKICILAVKRKYLLSCSKILRTGIKGLAN